MSRLIGTITIGQSPRPSLIAEISPLLGRAARVLERGALDGLDDETIASFAPADGDYVLVTKLRDGRFVTLGEQHILPLLQQAVDALEADGVSLILFLCTGEFPDVFTSAVPLIFPSRLLFATVPALAARGKIGVICPSAAQIAQAEARWRRTGCDVTAAAANPYAGIHEVKAAAAALAGRDLDLIVLDCIGYTEDMKRLTAEMTGRFVVLGRTLAARVVSELTG